MKEMVRVFKKEFWKRINKMIEIMHAAKFHLLFVNIRKFCNPPPTPQENE